MEPHIYQRKVDPEGGDSLALIARRVTPGSQVLELGVATGYFSRFLTQELGCTVDGVEKDPVMAEQARPHCRRLLVGDLEKEQLTDHFRRGAYDHVICADVLEHLYRPETVLAGLGQLLKPTGNVIISIPNVAYGGLILDLIEGNFMYGDEGLLDRTHIRFYTRKTFLDLLASLNYQVDEVETVQMPLEHSEFFGRLNLLPVPLKNYIFSRPDADVYQFIVTARPALLDKPAEPIHP
jgi:2-polyprenyl-3-methyl-5-hydroxy-6-metoxy-1,4-benzoquinol methylase